MEGCRELARELALRAGRLDLAATIGRLTRAGPTSRRRNSPPFSIQDSEMSGRMTIFVQIAIIQLTQ